MGVVQLKKSGDLLGSEFDEMFTGSGLVSYWTFGNNVNDDMPVLNNGTLSHGSIIFAHYLFNGNFNDSSSYAKNLTTSNMTYGPGFIGSAGYFNGTNSFGSISSTIGISGRASQTQSAWIKVDDLSSNKTISSFSSTATFSVLTTGSLQWECAGSFGASGSGAGRIYNTNGSKINVGSWFHVAIVQHTNMPTNQAVDIRDADIYINGSITSKALTSIPNITTSNTSFLIGALSSTSTFFSGSISDFRLYATTLNSDEIGSIYNAGVGTQTEFTDEDYVSGRFGSCLRFHRNSSVSIGNPASLQFGSGNDFTFSLWAQPWASGNKTTMGLFNRSFIAGFDIGGVSGSAGNFRFGVRLAGTSIISTSANQNFVVGSWYHVAGVHNSTDRTVQVFVNGVASTAQSVAALNWINGGTLQIGGTNVLSGNSSAYYGLIDDVRVYNRILGSAEIKEIYQNSPYFTTTSKVLTRNFLEAQTLTGSVKMSMKNNNSIYILGELVEN